MKQMKIRVPATTANLGPGFDCLGMALDLWNEIDITLAGVGIHIEIHGEGQRQLPRDESNLIYKAMDHVLGKQGVSLPEGLQIRCRNQIPISSGLGSSATAILAGVIGASKLFDLKLSEEEILITAGEIEEHFDNLSAAMFGGLVLTYPTKQGVRWKNFEITEIPIVICIPAIEISTPEARKVLPKNYELSDVVFNISHSNLLLSSLINQDFVLLAEAMRDKIHQPFRMQNIPGGSDALEKAIQEGAYGAALSGAGPGIIAICGENQASVGAAMQRAFAEAKLESSVIETKSINFGLQIK